MFKKDQKVWCAIYGSGTVESIHQDGRKYPVHVRFDNYPDFAYVVYTLDGKFQERGKVTLFTHPVKVVPDDTGTKPSIDWSHVKDEYKWLSVDANGCAYVSETEPVLNGSDYWQSSKGDYFKVNGLVSYSRGTCSWENSLVKRPK